MADIATVIWEDHAGILTVLGLLREGVGTKPRGTADPMEATGADGDTSARFVRALSEHLYAEEQVVYPSLLESGIEPELARGHVTEHAALKQLLAEIDGRDPLDERVRTRLETLNVLLAARFKAEEDEVLPAFSSLSSTRRENLADGFLRAKADAPTHPHPHAPSQAPLNRVTDPVIAVVDRVCDAITGRDEPVGPYEAANRQPSTRYRH